MSTTTCNQSLGAQCTSRTPVSSRGEFVLRFHKVDANHAGHRPRIFIDQSFTARSQMQSGVHRVVRRLSHWLHRLYDGECQAVIATQDIFRSADSKDKTNFQSLLERLQQDVVHHLPRPVVFANQICCRVLPFRQLRRWLLPEPGHRGIYRIPLSALQNLQRCSRASRMDLEIGEGDILVLPDAYWAIENFWPAVVKARQRGAFVCTVVYDLIPLDYPHFVVADAVTPFREYVSKLARHSDQIIAISMTVRDQVQQLLTQLEPSCEDLPVVDMFTLGAEQATDTNSKVRQVVSDTMTSEPVNLPYLMVATFEPRKNHEYVLDAFERIWRIEPTRKLCLVGRIGWLCESTLERIKNHPQLGKRLFVFHDLNDAEVQFCYQNSRAVLFPSIVEGFGLPIVEALSAQRHVFASDIPIHREVGGDNCIYCDLNSSEYLTSQILAFEQVRGNRGNLNHHRPLTWEESASEFLQCCLTGWLRRVS